MAQIDQTVQLRGSRSLPQQLCSTANRVPAGIGGWLLIYVIGRVAVLGHQLQLTIDPAGRSTVISQGPVGCEPQP